MKKFLALIMCAFSLLIISNNTVHAALVEKEVNFTLSNYFDTPVPDQRLHETTPNLYDAIDEVFHDIAPMNLYGENLEWYETTAKKDGVSYRTRLMQRPANESTPAFYSIQIYFGLWTNVSFGIYDGVYEVEGVAYGGYNYTITESMIRSTGGGTVRPTTSQILGTYSLKDFVDTELDPGDGTNITDFNDLPSTIGTLQDAADPSKVGRVYFEYDSDNLFEVYIILNGQQYNLGLLDLPGVEELNKAPLSPGIYWTEDNKRFIYYEFENQNSNIPVEEQVNIFLDDPEKITGFRPFVSMNLSN